MIIVYINFTLSSNDHCRDITIFFSVTCILTFNLGLIFRVIYFIDDLLLIHSWVYIGFILELTNQWHIYWLSFQKQLVWRHGTWFFLHVSLPWVNPFHMIPIYLKFTVIKMIIFFPLISLNVILFFLLLLAQNMPFQWR